MRVVPVAQSSTCMACGSSQKLNDVACGHECICGIGEQVASNSDWTGVYALTEVILRTDPGTCRRQQNIAASVAVPS